MEKVRCAIRHKMAADNTELTRFSNADESRAGLPL